MKIILSKNIGSPISGIDYMRFTDGERDVCLSHADGSWSGFDKFGGYVFVPEIRDQNSDTVIDKDGMLRKSIEMLPLTEVQFCDTDGNEILAKGLDIQKHICHEIVAEEVIDGELATYIVDCRTGEFLKV